VIDGRFLRGGTTQEKREGGGIPVPRGNRGKKEKRESTFIRLIPKNGPVQRKSPSCRREGQGDQSRSDLEKKRHIIPEVLGTLITKLKTQNVNCRPRKNPRERVGARTCENLSIARTKHRRGKTTALRHLRVTCKTRRILRKEGRVHSRQGKREKEENSSTTTSARDDGEKGAGAKGVPRSPSVA